jgi:hypothetical protein
MSSLAFFDELARPGDQIFAFLEGNQRGGDRAAYLHLVADIYRTLARIHDHVTEVVVAVGEARSVEEAAAILQLLDADVLRGQLKTQELCDELERLGIQLRNALPLADPGGSGTQVLRQLSEELEGRERRTAEMYAVRLWDLRNLAFPGSSSGASLEEIKRKANQISEELVLQKARFDLLAKRAEAKSRLAE